MPPGPRELATVDLTVLSETVGAVDEQQPMPNEATGQPPLELRLTAGRPCTVRLIGELDMGTAPIVDCLATNVAACCGRLVVDLSGCGFVDVAGCRALIRLAAQLPSVQVVNASPLAMRVLELAGWAHLLSPPATPGTPEAPAEEA
jgi:anti-anti-sigma factor